MTNFSPAAQAVLDAADAVLEQGNAPTWLVARGIAAALRAAADEVAPMAYEGVWTDGKMLQYEKQDPVRDKLLALAAELEQFAIR
jgi:hypothetical protein